MSVNSPQASAASKPPSQDVVALRQVFATVGAESCPHVFNFHMHTVCSDGQLQPEALIEQAIAIGLRGLAITDHHSVNGYCLAQQRLDRWTKQASRTLSKSRLLPRLWTGVEINAELLGIEVHVLGYAFNPEHPDLQIYLQRKAAQGSAYQAKNVIAAIHQAGGLAVLAHPARYKIPPDQLIPAAARLGVDGVETYYAYNNPRPWTPSLSQTQRVQELGFAHNLLNTCGTDTHGLSLLQRL